jgi:UDP-GlcNAc:undecaprenyl-phosphate GlcNAc-1-phosphate transferase
MHFLALVASALVAFAITSAVIAALRDAGVVRENYRGRLLPTAAGVVVVASAAIALVPLAAIDELADTDILRDDVGRALVYVLGVALLGLIDDLIGGRRPAGSKPSGEAPRGWRGHAQAAARGRLSGGLLKAVGSLGLALYALSGFHQSGAAYLLSVAVVLLATNFFNLLDLRPGRAIKSLALLGAALSFFWWDLAPLEVLGLFVGAVVVLAPFELRERAMLGDVGSNVLGAIAGLWLVLTLSPTGELAALALLVAITIYGEFRSINELVERNPLLRWLDSIGRLKTRRDSRLPIAEKGADG